VAKKKVAKKAEIEKVEIVGKILPKDTMILRHQVGTAEGSNGGSYEMTAAMNDMSPIVRSEKTGKWYVLAWSDIINLAVGAGIDKPGKVPG